MQQHAGSWNRGARALLYGWGVYWACHRIPEAAEALVLHGLPLTPPTYPTESPTSQGGWPPPLGHQGSPWGCLDGDGDRKVTERNGVGGVWGGKVVGCKCQSCTKGTTSSEEQAHQVTATCDPPATEENLGIHPRLPGLGHRETDHGTPCPIQSTRELKDHLGHPYTLCLPPPKSPGHATTPRWQTPLSFHWEQTLMAVMWMTPFIYLNCPVLRIYCSSNLWRGLPLRLRSFHKGTQMPASNEGVLYTAQVHCFSSALLCVDSTSCGTATPLSASPPGTPAPLHPVCISLQTPSLFWSCSKGQQQQTC